MQDLLVINELSNLTEEQYNYILNHLHYEKLKNQIAVELRKSEVNFDQLLDEFLDSLKPGTRLSYERFLKEFVTTQKNILDFTKKDADTLIENLSKNYSSSSVRLFVSALSSFFAKLVRWDILETNVWHGAKLPEQERSHELVVPDDKDVQIIIDYYKECALSAPTTVMESRQVESAKKMFVAITLLIDAGVRVGAIEGMSLTNSKYHTLSKGKKISGKIPESFYQALELTGKDESVLKELNKPMIQFNLATACKKLVSEGKIKEVYHPHSFRHYYAVKQYKANKDIYEVSRLLNHASIQITQRYLESMDIL